MNAAPYRMMLALSVLFSVYVDAFAITVIASGRGGVAAIVGSVVFIAAATIGMLTHGDARLSPWRTVVVLAAALVLPWLGAAALDPVRDGYSSGAWHVGGVTCLVLVLLWRHRTAAGWIAFGGLVVQTALWSGLRGLTSFGVFAAVLVVALLAAGNWALRRSMDDLKRWSVAERETLEWQAAQDAYETVRQERLGETTRIGGAMLQRIVDAGGRLEPAERAEARVLEQTIRDEIRGRRLLNDAVRAEVLRLRRSGAAVQVNDDGGLDETPDAEVAALLDRVALALAPIRSDRVIIRTAPKGSPLALTVVAMSVDPIAAALGMDDEDDQVDLWLELPRVPAPALG